MWFEGMSVWRAQCHMSEAERLFLRHAGSGCTDITHVWARRRRERQAVARRPGLLTASMSLFISEVRRGFEHWVISVALPVVHRNMQGSGEADVSVEQL